MAPGSLTAVATTIFLVATATVAALAPVPEDMIPPPGPFTGPAAPTLPEGWQPFAEDVHKQCGALTLVFRNPDLREDENDFIHAQGQFFIQFQAVGPNAKQVTRFSFSFGATHDAVHDNPTLNCNQGLPDSPVGKGTGGAYLAYYRSDFDAKDGFFVPILTNNVPDGEYGAAVHAYSGDCNPVGPSCIEVARAWARAVVDNCPGQLSAPNACPQDAPEAVIKQDHIKPWPVILPGDGVQTNDVPGLTVEFAEKVLPETLRVTLNGQPLVMQEWTPKARDTDLMPLNDAMDCPGGQQIRAVCQRDVYGPGWKWLGNVKENDIIRVSVKDLNGNLAEKTVHYGAATSSGTVELQEPNVVLLALNGESVTFKPGEFHEFNVRLDNIGAAEAHVSLLTETTPGNQKGFKAFWTDVRGNVLPHVVVPAGGQEQAKVRIETAKDTPEAAYVVKAVAEYDVVGQLTQKDLPLDVSVSTKASGAHHGQHGAGIMTTTPTNATNETASPKEAEGGSPGPAFYAVALGVAAAVIAFRRRRVE